VVVVVEEPGAVVVVLDESTVADLPDGVVMVVELDSVVEAGGVVGVVTTVVSLAGAAGAAGVVTVVLEVLVPGRSHPASAAVARTRAVATGTSFFMGFSVWVGR
jgi:hypothetical protein